MSLSAYDKLLLDLGERCGVKDQKTLRKSKELLSLLNSKQTVTCSETCKVIICLDIASRSISSDFNEDVAIKVSGCSRKNYMNMHDNIAKLLNMKKELTVQSICLIVGALEVCDSCKQLFEKYKMTASDLSVIEHPMYPCAAVLAVCKSDGHKINIPKLVELSRVKKPILMKLAEEFSKMYEPKVVDAPKKAKIEESTSKSHLTQAQKKIFDSEDNDRCNDKEEEMSDEKFNDWKRRMLEEEV